MPKTASLALALALAASPLAFAPAPADAAIAVGVSINIAPPALPVVVQPPMPAEGYLWVPGYWAYGPDGYYWVDGEWTEPPEEGLLWTPAWWGWSDGTYAFHDGYWGTQVGFYGGIDYGFGYTGVGFAGGYWDHGHLFYNRSVNNFGSVHITNVYSRTVINHANSTRVSFNGGAGGTRARPTGAERAAEREHHVPPTSHQMQRVEAARHDPAMRSTAIAAHDNRAPHTQTAAIRPPAAATREREPARGSEARPGPAETRRSAPQAARPAFAPASHAPARAPEARPETRPARAAAPHPAPQAARPPVRHEPAPVSHPAPAPRPSNVQPAHFAQPHQAAPAARPAPRPASQSRPAPQHGNGHEEHKPG
jgi:hypothetical protein